MDDKFKVLKSDFSYTRMTDGKGYWVTFTSITGRQCSGEVTDMELIGRCRKERPTKKDLITLKRIIKHGRR